MEIHNKFKTDFYWIEYGVERSQHFDISKGLGENEFILQFRKLKLEGQD